MSSVIAMSCLGFCPVLLQLMALWLDEVHGADGADKSTRAITDLNPHAAVFEGPDLADGHRRL